MRNRDGGQRSEVGGRWTERRREGETEGGRDRGRERLRDGGRRSEVGGRKSEGLSDGETERLSDGEPERLRDLETERRGSRRSEGFTRS
ncbi:MAG: hypothetical protein FD155_3279 [Bacteroidetes bacterium]|nr:MAG: hypothetical protein FD155_3279 [Bacteroidota bacterium]